MKVFLVFLAMLLLYMSFMCQWSDMDRYARAQRALKELAEEIACGAALLLDEDSYSGGLLCIDKWAADHLAFDLLQRASVAPPFEAPGVLSARIEIFDDESGYEEAGERGLLPGCPAVSVELTYSGREMFRLPFIIVTCMQRTAVYQWEPA